MAVLAASCSLATTTETTPTTEAVAATSPSTTLTAPTTTTTEAPGDPLLEIVAGLITLTEELRGLYFLAEPMITIVSPEELAGRLRADVEDELEPEDLARDQEALRILGVLDGDLDLATFYADLLAEQVVGFYDSESKEMVIQTSPDGLTEYNKLIIVHELTHALTDQHFEFGPLTGELFDAEEYDALSALSSLIEGDATYVEGLYVQSLPADALLEILAEFDSVDSPIFDMAPYYLQETLLAPYIEGLDFVTTQYESAGWSAVDLAYRVPPATTEQILHPKAYLRGESPMALVLGGLIPEPYVVGEESVWGESNLRSLLGSVLLPGPLNAAVEGWGGDSYRILWDGTRAIFQMHYLGDTPTDSDEFALAFASYLEAAVPADATWWMLGNGAEVVVVVASERKAGTALVASLRTDGFR